MSHSHTHCAHAHLAFCTTCQVVYCHDCDQEWTPKQAAWTWTSGYYGNTAYPPIGYKSMTNGQAELNPLPHRHGG